MNKKIKVIYFTFEGLFSSAFDSQVLTLSSKLINLSRQELDFKLIIFSPFSHILKREYWLKRNSVKNILKNNCFFACKIPFLYIFPQLIKLSLSINSLICFFVLFFLIKINKKQQIIFHCRGQIVSYILLKLKNIFYKNSAVFSDTRSIISIENLHYYRIKRNRVKLAKELEEIEDYVENSSDYLSCVSKSFKSYILSKNKSKISNIEVIPNCVDVDNFYYDFEKRKLSRKKIGIDNKFVVIYSGSLVGANQLLQRMIDIYKIIKNIMGDSIFLVLTSNKEYAEKVFLKSNLNRNNYIILSKSHNILNNYLITGDIGLLIREDNKLNNVARPIKFAEYLRSGVPVLINSSLHDISKSIKKHNFGFEINNCFDDTEVVKVALEIKEKIDFIRSDKYKSRISSIISKEMNWDNYLKSVVNIYSELSLSKSR